MGQFDWVCSECGFKVPSDYAYDPKSAAKISRHIDKHLSHTNSTQLGIKHSEDAMSALDSLATKRRKMLSK